MPLGPVRPAERDLHTALHTTQEITPEDIEQEVLIAPLTESSDLPQSTITVASRANPTLLSQYRSALTLFSQKQFAEAIQALESVLSDRALGARATLLIARSWWCELERPK